MKAASQHEKIDALRGLRGHVLPAGSRLVLFGSRARGDARPGSDWDLLVLLNKPERSPDDYDRYGYPFTELGFGFGEYFSVKVYTLSDWDKRRMSPFFKNVEREGVDIG
jgi:predicted nucleotidyltransferase